MEKALQTVEEDPGQRSVKGKDIDKLEKMKTEITRHFCQEVFRLSPRANSSKTVQDVVRGSGEEK